MTDLAVLFRSISTHFASTNFLGYGHPYVTIYPTTRIYSLIRTDRLRLEDATGDWYQLKDLISLGRPGGVGDVTKAFRAVKFCLDKRRKGLG